MGVPVVASATHLVSHRKQSVNNSNRELEELEARIKAMEERLSQNGVGSAPPASQKATDAASNLAAPATSTFHASRPSSSARPDLPTSAPPPPPGRAPPVPTANGPPLRAPPGRPAAGTAGYIPRMPSNISESSSLRDRGEYGVAH